MTYQETIQSLADNPQQLEEVYQAALGSGDAQEFKQAIDASFNAFPDNVLYAAWFHRLKYSVEQVKGHVIAWAWVIPLAVTNALLLWWLSADRFFVTVTGFQGTSYDVLPTVILLAAPISAVFVLAYLAGVGSGNWRHVALISLVLLAAGAYVLLTYPQLGTRPFQEQYLTLMAMHLPLLAWAGVGAFLIAGHRDPDNRFAFLIKSLEVFIVGGLFVIAGGLFTAISVGLFQALDVEFPEAIIRLFVAGGLGLIAVIATAIVYDPTAPPAGQSFEEGLSKLIAMLMRILLPLTLLLLSIYLMFIPFNFRAPFDNRDVLVVYNAMLFAVVALLVGATPLNLKDLSPRMAHWLRLGIIGVAALALTVSVYALAAILYRTALDRLTPNRLAFIGWNVINIALLLLVLGLQARARSGAWLHALHRAFSMGTIAYAAWTLVVTLALPWLFGIDQGGVEELPESVQRIIYEKPDPVLLKCSGSPHIYLLEAGEKRWIDTIATFESRGYVWRDVHFIPCDDLRDIPDGQPIPADAGPPPQP